MVEERNYHSTKLEFMALFWAVTQQFKDYLWGRKFLVRTDNNPLTYIMKSANLDATRHRWVGSLASFNFDIEYQWGKNNVVADTLSRYYCLPDENVKEFLTEAMSHRGAAKRAEASVPAVQDMADANEKLIEEIAVRLGRSSVQMNVTDWVREQCSDDSLKAVIDWIEVKKRGPTLKDRLRSWADTYNGKALIHAKNNLVLINGLLYRQYRLKDDIEDLHQFVVPHPHHITALNGCHRDARHQGQR